MKKLSRKKTEKFETLNIICAKSAKKIHGGDAESYIVKSDGIIYDTVTAKVGNTIVDDLNGLIR